jgi:hypothetical protein
VKQAAEMDVHCPLKVRRRHVFDRPDRHHARVVDEHVDAPRTIHDLMDEISGLGRHTDVAHHGRGTRSGWFQFGPGDFEFSAIACGNCQESALTRQLTRNKQSQPSRAAGNHHRAAAEVESSRHSFDAGESSGGGKQADGEADLISDSHARGWQQVRAQAPLIAC